ncbi:MULTISPECIES: SDR family oxidoreductase [Rossellomorea]|uniref:SDR family NAD(P)-dependent oxidoreductase n=1 Tax=Rossellomorea TaxID=2837508 RepID=UPI001CCA4759|nr:MULTISPECIES: SDR family oxidoreductase [Rossellomorea]MCA0148852.1 SDR family oxidoreductase [Rossellomorea vietnamensis]UTE79247.1 SDR family oxidoreductase [Rossellomorea sp. KS-H15a]WGG47311.1 SDR family oxidoreductase [Rossellomorea sp. DA94]
MKSRIVCITGGASGIGKTLVEEFAREGAMVEFIDKDVEKGREHSNRLNAEGYTTRFHEADVGVHDEVKGVFNKIKEDHGVLDVLINNAGVSRFMSFWDMEPDDWNSILSSNLSSVFYCSREAASLMKNQGGCIINMASTRATMSEPDTEAYSATKGGIVSLTHSLAITLSEVGIRVNSISPGWIQTEDYDTLRDIDHSQHPSGRVGKPGDIARACLFLAHPDNDFITGENIVIDGGMTKKMMYEH